MKTPIYDFVKEYIEGENARLHMPGHKGIDFLGIEKFDITEIDGADTLYHGNGIIKQSENNATALFGTAKTLYSTEGSSLSIRAMVYLALLYAKSNGITPKIAAGRNAHKVFMTACALLDVDVDWLYPENVESIVSCKITPRQLRDYFSTVDEKPAAVYITSPDYLGNTTDIAEISTICREESILLIVDNAHGAYLNFLPENLHPIALGADICCDSAHKTLPVLTGGGYLHISEKAPSFLQEKAEDAMSLFASTSPSYLILQSLDLANLYLDNNYKAQLARFIKETEKLKADLVQFGFALEGDEPLKITINAKEYGYTGNEFAEILRKKSIFCEFYDPDCICFMVTPENNENDLSNLKDVLTAIPRKASITKTTPYIGKPQKVLSIREALLSEDIELPINQCEGKILANTSLSCPPAIPIVVCGEKIDKTCIECMKYYGIESCKVIK